MDFLLSHELLLLRGEEETKVNNNNNNTASQWIIQEEGPSLGNRLNDITMARQGTRKENVKNLKENIAKLEVMKRKMRRTQL